MCKNDVEKTSFGRVLHCGLRWSHHSLKLFQKFSQWNLSDVVSDRIRSMKTAPFLQGFALINFFSLSFSSLSSRLLYFLSSSFSPFRSSFTFCPCLSSFFLINSFYHLNLLVFLFSFFQNILHVLRHALFFLCSHSAFSNSKKTASTKQHSATHMTQWDLSVCLLSLIIDPNWLIISRFLWPFLNWSWQCTMAHRWLRSIWQWQTRVRRVRRCPSIVCLSQFNCD